MKNKSGESSSAQSKEATQPAERGGGPTIFGLDWKFVVASTAGMVAATMIALYTGIIALQRETVGELRQDVAKLEAVTMELEESFNRLSSVVGEIALTRTELTFNEFAVRCEELGGSLNVATFSCSLPGKSPLFFEHPLPAPGETPTHDRED